MIKFLFKTIIVVIVLFGIGQYSTYLITGRAPDIGFKKPTMPNINIPDMNMPNSISELKNDISEKISSVSDKFDTNSKGVATTETYLYKWRDDKGVIHYTSEKPTEKIKNLESIKIHNETNVVPAVQGNNSSEAERTSQNGQQTPTTSEIPTNIYSPEGIKQLFDQAKNVQNLMNEQFTQTEELSQKN